MLVGLSLFRVPAREEQSCRSGEAAPGLLLWDRGVTQKRLY